MDSTGKEDLTVAETGQIDTNTVDVVMSNSVRVRILVFAVQTVWVCTTVPYSVFILAMVSVEFDIVAVGLLSVTVTVSVVATVFVLMLVTVWM